ncbi:MAG TPA: NAD(P)H-dependent oxidoreductase [Usitatibacter sp.]|nr:NAD(P)H-dependent oxidoreductase [Usitatibacter sp.]
MKTLLQLNASLFSGGGESSRLAATYVAQWRAANPGARVIARDLASHPVPHLTAETFLALLAKPEERSPAQREAVALSDALIAELEAADVIVLGLPMYNYGVPSTLKAYFDHVARAGRTFRYTDKGPQGLLAGKKAVVLATRGGMHAGTPRDTETAYVREFLGFIGIRDVEFIFAEGLALGENAKASSLASAHRAIEAAAAERDEEAAIAA